jgi:hypothetical protein
MRRRACEANQGDKVRSFVARPYALLKRLKIVDGKVAFNGSSIVRDTAKSENVG